MGYGSKLNISIKNDRIILLEKRAAAIEQLLHDRIKATDLKIDANTTAVKELLGVLGNIQSELEFVYEELISRTVRGRWKRLKELLRKSESGKGNQT